MKYKTTTKAIKNLFPNIKSAGYCSIQHLLRTVEPVAYTCGVYGWNYDVYNINGLTICTGYRGMPGERLEKCSEYEEKAAAIWGNYSITYDERAEQVKQLLKEFCSINGGY